MSASRRIDRARIAALTIVLAFWSVSAWRIDRFPPVHEDEPWILSPGYKLFTQGVYGSDLFSGFHGMEQHYFDFMPLMPMLQGAGARLWGVGVWPMRFLPIAIGALTLALTFLIARRLAGSPAGALSGLLLLTWAWTPPGDRMRGSGIPLVDVSRIARYDILAALLGLCALWWFVRARESGRLRHDFLAGAFVGLAGMAHAYGLLWIAALWLALILDRRFFARRPITRSVAALLGGVVVVWLFWVLLIIFNWSDFSGQLSPNRRRFDVQSVSFYLGNLANEARRWLPAGRAATLAWPGFVWVAATLPAALLWLTAQVAREHDRRKVWLLAPCLSIPLLFALLLDSKSFNYLASLAPLFAIALAWMLVDMYRSHRWIARTAAVLVGLPIVMFGVAGIAHMQRAAAQAEPPARFHSDLDRAVPATARVLGLPQYWLALIDREYRSFVLPFYLSDPQANRSAISFEAALGDVAPDIVLLDPIMARIFADVSTSDYRERGEQFQAYLRRHRARVVAEVRDPGGAPVQVYQLDP